MQEQEPLTKRERITAIIVLLFAFAVMGGIIYLAAISPSSDHSDSSYMEMMP